MRVAVQEDVDVRRRLLWWNVDQPQADAVSLVIDDERPLSVRVAISAYDRKRRPNRANAIEKPGPDNVAKVPDFIGPGGVFLEVRREMIVRVREDKDAHACGFSSDERRVLRRA